MADLQKTVEIVFGGRNELSQVIGNVERSLSSLNDASAPFANMADNVLKAEAAVIALGAAFAGLSIAKAGEFSDQFAEISTLIDGNAGDLGGYRQEILDYATTSTQSLASINGAVYSAISAGVSYTDALGVMTSAEKLAVAGKADLNSTLVGMVSTLNAYGASTSEAADYSDIFFTTVKMGQTTIPELAASLSQVTGVASAAGVPFDQLSAAVAGLTAYGMPTSQAITAIKAALSNIIKPSSDAQKAAAELGIEFNTTALRSQGLGGFMETLQTATGGNIDTMSRLFGSTEGLNAMMVLAGDSSGKFSAALAEMERRAGATDVAFAKMADNFALNNQKLINNLDVVLVGTGTQLLDEYSGVIDALIANLQGIGTAIDAGSLDGLINIFESAMGDITQLLNGVAEVLPEALAKVDWGSLEQSFENLKTSAGGAFDSLFGDIDLASVDGVRSAIQTLVNLLAGLTNTTSGVVDGMNPLFTALGKMATGFAGASADSQQFAGQIIGMGKSVNEITSALSGASSALSGMSNGLLLLGGSSVINAVRALATSIGAAGLGGALTGAAGGAVTLAAGLGQAGLLTALAAAAYKTGEWIGGMTESEQLLKEQPQLIRDVATAHGLVADKLAEMSSATGLNITSMEQFNQLEQDGILIYNEATGAWEAAANAQELMAASANNAGVELTKQQANAHELTLQLNELTSKEHIVQIQADTQVAVAQVAADTERIKAALELEGLNVAATTSRIEAMYEFNSTAVIAEADKITAAFEASASSIGSLSAEITGFGDVFASDDLSFWDRKEVGSWIDDQMSQQQKIVDAQVAMQTAQTKLIELKYDRLSSGEALIRIDSDGLEPALEQVLWSIIEKAKLRMSMEESELLLGL